MTRGEIAHYEHFLLLLQCFQKAFVSKALEIVYVRGKGKVNVMYFGPEAFVYKIKICIVVSCSVHVVFITIKNHTKDVSWVNHCLLLRRPLALHVIV